MVFQVLYGIEMGLNSISVDPWLHNEMGAAGARGVGGTSRAEQAGSGQSRLGVGEEQADKEESLEEEEEEEESLEQEEEELEEEEEEKARTAFDWSLGQIWVRYRRGVSAELRFPRTGRLTYRIGGMAKWAGVLFMVRVECRGQRDFGAAAGDGTSDSGGDDDGEMSQGRKLGSTRRAAAGRRPASKPRQSGGESRRTELEVASHLDGSLTFDVVLSRCPRPSGGGVGVGSSGEGAGDKEWMKWGDPLGVSQGWGAIEFETVVVRKVETTGGDHERGHGGETGTARPLLENAVT
jgi:hypothetical protein